MSEETDKAHRDSLVALLLLQALGPDYGYGLHDSNIRPTVQGAYRLADMMIEERGIPTG